MGIKPEEEEDGTATRTTILVEIILKSADYCYND